MLDLKEYPQAIYDLQVSIQQETQRLNELQATIKSRSLEFESTAANDATLKNETMRKAYVANMMESDGTVKLAEGQLQTTNEQIGYLKAMLALRENEFKVARLEAWGEVLRHDGLAALV